MVPCVGADRVERCRHVDLGAFAEHTFGLLDDRPAVQRVLQLTCLYLQFSGGLVVQDRDTGDIGECLRELHIGIWHGSRPGAEQVQCPDDRAA